MSCLLFLFHGYKWYYSIREIHTEVLKSTLGQGSAAMHRGLGSQAIDNVKCFHLCSFSRRLDLSVNEHPLGAVASLQLTCDEVHM